MTKTVSEINQKIKNREAVVVTAEEMIEIVRENGAKKASEDVDVVTTGTFGAMCSSGAFLNFGHSDPPMKLEEVWLNDVHAYGGIAAVDVYIGATEKSRYDEHYGGAHVIEDLVNGKSVKLKAKAHGTDCYPKKRMDTIFRLSEINQAILLNPRNCYQNYAAATNSSKKIIHTYMGTLLSNLGNVTYSTSGQLSPLLNDPYLRTIGVGTKIFIGGAQGYVIGEGTQHNTNVARRNGIPMSPAGTLMVKGNLKEMNSKFLRAATFHGYGHSLYVGIGIPIPVLDEEIAKATGVSNAEIFTNIYDYSLPKRSRPSIKEVSYAELRTGAVEINGKNVETSSLSSYKRAREIANELKKWIGEGEFLLNFPLEKLPQSEFKPMQEIKKAVLVMDIMKKTSTCGVDDTIEHAAELMVINQVNHIPVVSGDTLVGIITSWDVAKAIGTRTHKLRDIMTKEVVTVESSDPIDVAAVRMHKNKISALPVVDWMKKPMGIITSEDISKLMSIPEFKT